MKKGATPQLDHKWWSKNKPKLVVKSTGFGNALKAYQVADERLTAKDMSPDDIVKACAVALKALSEVKKKLVVAIDSFNKKIHSDEIAVMKKYPKIILGEENRIKEMAKRAKDSASAPAAAPKQKIGKNLTYFEVDIGKKVKSQFSPEWLDGFENFSLNLTLNSDISQALTDADDAQTLQFMVVDAQKVAEACVTQIVALMRKADSAIKGKTADQVDKILSDAETKINKTFATAAKAMAAVPEARWKKFIATNKQYKAYKLNVAKTFTLGTLGIAGSIAGLAATPFTGGASGALAIVGLVRSCAALAREMVNVKRDVERVYTVLQNDLKSLEKVYRDADGKARKAAQGTAEVASSVVKGLVGTDPVWATIPKCKSNAELLSNKLAGLVVKSNNFSKEAVKGIRACDALEKQFKGSKDKAAVRVLAKLQKARVALDKALSQASDTAGKADKFTKKSDALLPALKELEKTNPKFATVFDKVFPIIVNLSLAGANAQMGFADATKALDYVNTSLGLFNDVVGEIESNLG